MCDRNTFYNVCQNSIPKLFNLFQSGINILLRIRYILLQTGNKYAGIILMDIIYTLFFINIMYKEWKKKS